MFTGFFAGVGLLKLWFLVPAVVFAGAGLVIAGVSASAYVLQAALLLFLNYRFGNPTLLFYEKKSVY